MAPTFSSICSLSLFWTILNILLTCLNISSISSFYLLNQYLNLFWTFLHVLVNGSLMFNFKIQAWFSLFSHLFRYLFKIPLLSRLIRFNFANFYLISYIFILILMIPKWLFIFFIPKEFYLYDSSPSMNPCKQHLLSAATCSHLIGLFDVILCNSTAKIIGDFYYIKSHQKNPLLCIKQ